LLCALTCIVPSFAQGSRHNRVFGGYFQEFQIGYTGYHIADVQRRGIADDLTHLIYAFANVTPTASPACAIADPFAAWQNTAEPSVTGRPYRAPLYGNFGAIQQLKELHPSLKTLISLGGQAGNVSGFVTGSATPAARAALVSSCIDLFVKGNIAPGVRAPGLFDGFNVDWEFPTAADKRNFTALLKEFRTQLNALGKRTGKKYILTFDSPSDARRYANIDLRAAAKQVNFLTIDGYDLATSSEKQTNEASPLFDADEDPIQSQHRSIDDTVRAYRKAGVPASKYTIGMPLYAVGWTGVSRANHGLYQTASAPAPVLTADGTAICPSQSQEAPKPGCDTLLTPGYLTDATIKQLIKSKDYAVWYDEARVGATLYNPSTGTFYSYDNPTSLATKTAYIRKHKLGGGYVWAVNDDDADATLIKVIAAGLK
jgi:chitinase